MLTFLVSGTHVGCYVTEGLGWRCDDDDGDDDDEDEDDDDDEDEDGDEDDDEDEDDDDEDEDEDEDDDDDVHYHDEKTSSFLKRRWCIFTCRMCKIIVSL